MQKSPSIQSLSPAELIHSFDGMEATLRKLEPVDFDKPGHVEVSRDVRTAVEIWNRLISIANEQHVRYGSALVIPQWDSKGQAADTLFGESVEPAKVATDLELECRRILGYTLPVADHIYANEDEEVGYTNVTAGVHSNGVSQ